MCAVEGDILAITFKICSSFEFDTDLLRMQHNSIANKKSKRTYMPRKIQIFRNLIKIMYTRMPRDEV